MSAPDTTGAAGSSNSIAVALVHSPVLNRLGETSTTAITSMDVHDFSRTCAFYDAAPVYLVHPAEGMHAMVKDICGYWEQGAGGERNPGRREVLSQVRMLHSLEEVFEDAVYRLWYTSASPPQDLSEAGDLLDAGDLCAQPGPNLIVFGTGSGLDVAGLPPANGWLRPIDGAGKVRHLSVRAALAIYMDRCRRPDR
ncbi:MAG: RNA methyltransferase [Mariprofundaceae bacterium]|nr:RNA methyltransferase [Mariprofundaceae bacterium]